MSLLVVIMKCLGLVLVLAVVYSDAGLLPSMVCFKLHMGLTLIT